MLRSVILAPLITLAISMTMLVGVHALENDRHTAKQQIQTYHKLVNIHERLEMTARNHALWLETFAGAAAASETVDKARFENLLKTLPPDVSQSRAIEVFHQGKLFWASPPNLNRLEGLDDTVLLPQEMINEARGMTDTVMTSPIPMENTRQSIAFMTPIRTLGEQEDDPDWGYAVMFMDSDFLLHQAGVVNGDPGLRVSLRQKGNTHHLIHGSPATFDNSPVRLDAQMPGHRWELAAIPAENWTDSPYTQIVWAMGLILVSIGTFGAWLIAHQLTLRAQEREEYRHLVHNARTIIVRFDISGRITFMNEYGQQFFGYSEEELLGKPLIGTILPPNDLSGNDMRRMLVSIIDTPGEFSFHENENLLKNGDRVWIAWANKAISRRNRLKEILAVGTDITERRRFEEALRESEAKHRMLAENVTDVIWGLDANLNFTYISPSDRQLRGYSPEEVLGRPLWEFITPGSRQALLDSVAELESAEHGAEKPRSIVMVLELLCRNGKTVWVEALCTILYNENGNMVGMQGVCRDITDRIRIQALRDDVERMARHDLKTPLSAVISLPEEIAKEGNLTEKQQEMLEVIASAGSTMLELVNRSLDLHKMETGTYDLDAKQVDMIRLVDMIKAEVRGMAAQKGVSFALESGEEEMIIHGEKPLLHSMISNLLKNAIEASPEGSAVGIRVEKSGPWVRVIITNKGSVPKELRETFFDKYSRHNASKGSGLGTYSAKLVARTHGGDILLDTQTSGQTKITVTLPCARQPVRD